MNRQNLINTAVLKDRLQVYAMKVGRISARPVLLLYFIMVSKDTPKSDKLMILSTISYLVFPIDLVSAKRLPIIGWIDEAFSLSVAYAESEQKYYSRNRAQDECIARQVVPGIHQLYRGF